MKSIHNRMLHPVKNLTNRHGYSIFLWAALRLLYLYNRIRKQASGIVISKTMYRFKGEGEIRDNAK